MRKLVALSLLAAPAIAFAELPLGEELAPALAVDISPEGLQAVAQIAPALVPPDPIAIDDIYLHDIGYDPLFSWIEIWEYELRVEGVEIELEITDIALNPATGAVDVSGEAYIWINEPKNPMFLSAWAEGLGFLSVGDECTGNIDPFIVDLSTSMSMDIIEGPKGRTLDVTVSPFIWSTDIGASDVNLDCTVGDILDLFDFIGIDLIGLVWPLVEPTLNDQLDTLRVTLEETVEDAFSQASISTEIDLLGSPLTVAIEPSAVQIAPEGVRLELAGYFDTVASDCVAGGPAGSLQTTSPLQNLGTNPTGVPFDPHLGITVDDDFINSALYAVYASGILCQVIDADFEGLPIELSTSILGILHPTAYEDLFPESAPLLIALRPGDPPVASVGGAHDVDVDIAALELDFYAQLDGRMARLVGTSLDLNTGVDINFDGKTGNLAIDVPISGDDLITSVTHNEFAPGEDQVIADSFGGLFDSIVGPLIGGLLADATTFAIPSFGAFGLSEAEAAPSGAGGDMVGLFARIGEVPYGDPEGGLGCDKKGGCDSGSGCGGGCGGGGIPTNSLFFALPIFAAALRRRDRKAE
jgi:hypothetical protein